MEDFIRPDQPSKCTWLKNTSSTDCPHIIRPLQDRPNILPNILESIGHTPLVKINNITQSSGIKCEILAKCEFMNPGGSVKDRIGYRMVIDAEDKGIIKPGFTLIEPTSGNTGVGIALAAAVKGYKCIIVMPEKMSNEKVCVLRALGAEIIRTPTAAAFDSPEGLIAVSQKLQKEIPNSYILDQYRNAGNPLAHFDGTCDEILEQCDGKVDMIVVGTGTGGTISGIGRRIKEKYPDCVVVGVDPEGSILAEPSELNLTDTTFYEVEGIGYDFIPTVLDRSVVDRWIKSNDKEALPMARRLIREEGLLCGGSSGTAMYAALKAAAELKEGQRCVVILPDSIRNYLSKFVSDSWMAARNLIEETNLNNLWWAPLKVNDMKLKPPIIVSTSVNYQEAVNIMKLQNLNQLPVEDKNGKFKGMVLQSVLLNKLVNCNLTPNDCIDKAIYYQFVKVTRSTTLARLSQILDKEQFVVLINDDQAIDGIITHLDLLAFITKK